MALLLDRRTIQGLLDMDSMIGILESAFGELAAGSAVMPQRTAVADADVNGWYAFMPAQLKGMGALGVKSVTVYKDNPARGIPATLATIVLMDGETGQTIAVMDGGYITAMRTGAVTGLATKYLARADSKTAGVMGAGVQARTQLWGMSAGAPNLEKALVFSLDPPEAQRAFAGEMSETLGFPVEAASGAREMVESVDILSLATTAATPIIDGDWVKPGLHINGIGSHAAGVRELDTKTVVKSKLVCDQVDACLAEAGDVQIPIEEGALSPDDIYGEIGELIAGEKAGRESGDEITLFKSVGLSIQDISAARYVYARALEEGAGTEFAFS